MNPKLPNKIKTETYSPNLVSLLDTEIVATLNSLIGYLEEKERNEAEFVKNWNAQSIQLPEEKECEYPNKNMDCYCEICIYCKEAILKNQQIR